MIEEERGGGRRKELKGEKKGEDKSVRTGRAKNGKSEK